jgi:hypothetical protein
MQHASIRGGGDERSSHGIMMMDIYQEVASVIVWLGEESVDSKLAMETAEK